MKKEEKRLILVLLIVLAVFIVIWVITGKKKETADMGATNTDTQQTTTTQTNNGGGEFVQVLEDGTKLNTSSKLDEVKKLDDLEISNIQLTNKDGKTVLLATVTNKGSKETKVTLVNIKLYDKAGKEIATVPGVISPLKAGATTQLNTTTQHDYSNIYDFKIEKKK